VCKTDNVLGRFISSYNTVFKTRTTVAVKLTHLNKHFFIGLQTLGPIQSLDNSTSYQWSLDSCHKYCGYSGASTVKCRSPVFQHCKLGHIHYRKINRFYFLVPNLHRIKCKHLNMNCCHFAPSFYYYLSTTLACIFPIHHSATG